MAPFARSTQASTKSRRESSGPVFCVGWKAFVNWPAHTRSCEQVPLTDVHGTLVPNDWLDGQQVEILSWRPGSRAGLTYQIRRVADGSEGWLVAHHLRRQAAVEESAAAKA